MPTLRQELAAQFQTLADPERALQQQAYTKSAMPYAGLPAPLMRKTAREVFKRFPLHQASLWLQAIRTLWDEATVCEERYAAIELFNLPLYKKALLDASALDLLRHMVVSGARWDYVDPLATNVLGGLLKADLQLRRGVICSWAVEDNLWLRRSAILAQLKYKADTDVELLCAAIEPSMGDNNFFARKAIGWALREYTRTDPDFVIAYVKHHKDALSNLSKREAWKLLIKNGFVDAIP